MYRYTVQYKPHWLLQFLGLDASQPAPSTTLVRFCLGFVGWRYAHQPGKGSKYYRLQYSRLHDPDCSLSILSLVPVIVMHKREACISIPLVIP